MVPNHWKNRPITGLQIRTSSKARALRRARQLSTSLGGLIRQSANVRQQDQSERKYAAYEIGKLLGKQWYLLRNSWHYFDRKYVFDLMIHTTWQTADISCETIWVTILGQLRSVLMTSPGCFHKPMEKTFQQTQTCCQSLSCPT